MKIIDILIVNYGCQVICLYKNGIDIFYLRIFHIFLKILHNNQSHIGWSYDDSIAFLQDRN